MAQKRTSSRWGEIYDEPETPKKMKKSKDDNTPVIVYENPDAIKRAKKVIDTELKRLESLDESVYSAFNEGERFAFLLLKKIIDTES